MLEDQPKPELLGPKPGRVNGPLTLGQSANLSMPSLSPLTLSRDTSPVPIRGGSTGKTWKSRFQHQWKSNEGLFLIIISQLFAALMNVTTRLLELEKPGMQPFQILFARQGITAMLCTGWMWWQKVPDFPFGKKDVRTLLVLRALSGFFGIYGMYYSLQYLPVADATVITFLAPSVAGYWCYLFLHEPFPRSSQYASIVSLLGVVLIARPTSFFAASTNDNIPPPTPSTNLTADGYHASLPESTPQQRLDAVMVALLGVFGSAGAFTAIRHIGSRAHPLVSVNYFSVFCTLISLLALTVPSPLDLSFRLPVNSRQWSMLLFLGTCGFTMQFLLTKGLSSGGKKEGGRGMNMIYTNMLFAMGLDRWVFGVVPGLWSLIGGGIVLVCAIWVAVQKPEASGGDVAGDDAESGMRMREQSIDQESSNVAERAHMLQGEHIEVADDSDD